MSRLTEAQRHILTALSDIPDGYSQRIDGLRVESGVIELWGVSFRWALGALLRRGLIDRTYRRQFWPSCNGMPNFSITDLGRSALAQSEEK